MERSRVEHKQGVETIKQTHQLQLRSDAHDVDLKLATLQSNTDLGERLISSENLISLDQYQN